MSQFIERAEKMYETINRWIIPFMWGMAGFTLCLFITVYVLKRRFNRKIDENSGKDIKRELYRWLDVLYTIFIVLISLFPLFGMLGTVSALLTLDISGATEELKANFFQALDTTGLGLIFAIIFKIVNACQQSQIEETISKAKKMLEKGGAKETNE